MSDNSEEMEVRPEDALQVAQNNAGRVTELEERIEDLCDRLDDYEQKLTRAMLQLSEREDKDYAELSMSEKVEQLRAYAYRRAKAGTGRATLDYKDVMWGVFDGNPGAAHCYKLMKRAAEYDEQEQRSDFPGIEWQTPKASNHRIAIDASRLERRRTEFFPEKKGPERKGSES